MSDDLSRHIQAERERLKDITGRHKRLTAEEIAQWRSEQLDCQTCKDTGFVSNGITDKYNPLFGKLTACPDCDRSAGFLLGNHGISANEVKLTWASLMDLDTQANVGKAKAAVQNLLALGSGWLYLHGTYGLAKTLICKIAVAEGLRMGKDSLYTNMSELMDFLRAAYNDTNPDRSAARLIDEYAAKPVLVIDEFEKIKGTEWVSERRFRLLDKRYERALRDGDCITIFASNIAPEGIKDAALISRIRDQRFSVIELRGPDHRRIGALLDV